MLTPQELQNKIYNTSYDYRDNAMNEFMRDIQENYEQLYAKCVDFNSRIEQLNSSLQYYKSIENTLQNALFLAEKVSEEKLEEASMKAEKIENEALTKADDIVAEARGQLTDINSKISDLQVEYEKYMSQYKNLVKGQLDLLEKEPFTLIDAVNGAIPDMEQTDDVKKKDFNIDMPFPPLNEKHSEQTSDTLNINFETVQNDNFNNTQNNNSFSGSADDIAKFIENATVNVNEINHSIDDMNDELNNASHGLENIAQNLENTAEILIGEEYLNNNDKNSSTEAVKTPEENLSDNVQNIQNQNEEDYTNFSNSNYSQSFSSVYQQQYNPQYNQNFKQYNYEQPQYDPSTQEDSNSSSSGFFKRKKK